MTHHDKQGARRVLATLMALTLLATPIVELRATQGTPAAKPPPASHAAAAPAAGAPDAAPIDGGWPRAYETPTKASLLVYQPQVASWTDQKRLVGYAAVSYRAPGADKPALGTLKIESDTRVAVAERLVSFEQFTITESNFPTLQKDKVREIATEVDKAIPNGERVIALDRVLASVEKSQITPRNVEGVKADPPAIFFSKTPAVLVIFDSEPIWSPIKDSDLKYAVNTNWDVFQHGPTQTFYLLNAGTWLKAVDVNGPWTPAGPLPASFAKLPADESWKEIKASLPGKATAARKTPRVFVSTTPAELILLTGEPGYQPIAGTSLLWVSNTDGDVFRLGKTGAVYYLVAGRWFSAPDFTGPWTFATPSLPEAFTHIPVEHPRSRVLASVPGTPQAAEAVLLAQVPQTARVQKAGLKAPEVVYQGEPQFAPVEKTSVARAVNTDKDIIKVGDLYYMCFQGVWFMSRSATGPWEVTASIPTAIYEIPVSSPAYHVTYVTVDNSTPDTVTFVAAAGYTGMMVAWGCAVWGTGYYYPPYVWYGGYYPVYHPYFPTYGYSAWYNPWTGSYGRSAVAYGPYGGAGMGARYNPYTGTYARGAAAWGPYGARGVAEAYNPRTGAYGVTRQGSNVYGSWGSSYVQRGDDWARTNRYTNRATGATTRTIRTDEGAAISRRGPGGSGFVAGGEGGNIYAGHDGQVYRRQDGTWQKYDNGGWANTEPRPTPSQTGAAARERPATAGTNGTAGQLDRDSVARREGAQRTRDYGSYRSSGGSSRSAGTYRPSGGGARRGGGGGRRR